MDGSTPRYVDALRFVRGLLEEIFNRTIGAVPSARLRWRSPFRETFLLQRLLSLLPLPFSGLYTFGQDAKVLKPFLVFRVARPKLREPLVDTSAPAHV